MAAFDDAVYDYDPANCIRTKVIHGKFVPNGTKEKIMPDEKNAVVRWLEGKKTYAVAGVILACGVLKHFGVEVPEFVWAALAAFGLGFLRMGVSGK